MLDAALDTCESLCAAGLENVAVLHKAGDEIDRLNLENTALRTALVDLVLAVATDPVASSSTRSDALVAAEALLKETS